VAESSYARLMRNPNYFRVFSAGIGSLAGQAIASVCLIWLVAVRTDSALDVGILGASYLVASILFSTLGGTLVDRYDRRRLMILADVARGIAMASAVLVLEVHGFDLVTLLVAYAAIGAFSTLFNPAEQAIVPALVGAPDVADANGLVRSSRSAIQFVGAALGGVLIVTVGPVVGLAINAATFALSAGLLTGMRVPSAPSPTAGVVRSTGYFEDLKAGFAWLSRATAFLQLTISATFFNFCSSVVATFLVFYATRVLHGSALVFAGLLAAEVAGVAIGSVLVGRVHAERFAGKAWVVPYGVVSGAVAIALPLWPVVPVAIGAIFAIGLLGGFAGTAWLTAAQLMVPTEMQGRYFGIDALGSIAIIPAAQIGGAFLIDAYGVRMTFLLIALLWLAVGAVFVAPRTLWKLGVGRPSPGLTLRSDADASGTPGSRGGTRGA
jgi:Na+/melibiose symporter-like transporter